MTGVEVHAMHVAPGRAEYDSADFTPHTGDRTHAARLERAVQSTSPEIGRLKLLAQTPHGDDFCMRRWIMPELRFIVTLRNNLAVPHDDTTYLTGARCLITPACLFNGQAHEPFIFCGANDSHAYALGWFCGRVRTWLIQLRKSYREERIFRPSAGALDPVGLGNMKLFAR